jgi:hypothetical protein
LQTPAAKRAEFHFNGEATSSSGETRVATATSVVPARAKPGGLDQAQRLSVKHPDDKRNEFFALDSASNFLHSGLTSQPALQQVPRSCCLPVSPVRDPAICLTSLISTKI